MKSPNELGDCTNRNKLLKTLMEKGLEPSERSRITLPMRGKPWQERERIAKEILERLETGNDET